MKKNNSQNSVTPIDIRPGLEKKLPTLMKIPLLGHILYWLLKTILHQERVNQIIATYAHQEPFTFNKSVLDYFSCTFTTENLTHIPKHGSVVMIANHPLGALEALTLIEIVRNIRHDVKIVANELLMYIEPLQPLFLPVDAMNAKTAKENIANIHKALANNEAVIIFPAGEVSRQTPQGIRDGEWNKGFLRFAKKAKAPLLPIKIEAKNSWYFYLLSKLSKPLSALFLSDQMFRRKNRPMHITIGNLITYKTYNQVKQNDTELVNKLKQDLYQL
jgi:putative hemolysin